MSEYFLTGRGQDGRKATERVDADSAPEALAIFRARGFDEVVLHTDDVGARYTNQSAVEEHISPKEFVAFRQSRGAIDRAFFLIRKLYASGWKWLAACAALLGFRRYQGRPWGTWDWIFASYLAFPIVFAFGSQLIVGTAGRYRRLLEAVSWGRWEEALRLVQPLKGKAPPEECTFREAGALAGLGRLDEGLKLLEPFSDGKAMPRWLYLSRLPEVYAAGGRREMTLPLVEEAAEEAPENAVVLLDLARAILRHSRDTRRAKEVLDRAKGLPLSDLATPFVTQTEGILALDEGRAREAVEKLEAADRALQRFRHSSALMGSVLDTNHAYLAMAHAAAGDMAAATKHYRIAEPRLRALKSEDLIARCERAIGNFSA